MKQCEIKVTGNICFPCYYTQLALFIILVTSGR